MSSNWSNWHISCYHIRITLRPLGAERWDLSNERHGPHPALNLAQVREPTGPGTAPGDPRRHVGT